MEFIDIILNLIEQKGTTKNKVVTTLGLGKNSFVDWKKNGNIPNGETLSKLAEYFNVSTDYLLGIDEKDNDRLKDVNFAFSNFSKEDMDIVRRTNQLPTKKKKAILNLLDALEEDEE